MALDNFSSFFDLLTLGAYRSSPEGRLLRANMALARLHGFASEAELLNAANAPGVQSHLLPGRQAELANQLKKYGDWYRANQDSTALDLRIKELSEKRDEYRIQLAKREDEIKKRLDKEKIFLDKRDPDELDSQGSIDNEDRKSVV